MSIPRISAKKLKKLGGKPVYSTITASRKAPRKRNPKRKASEFKRCYGSKRRVEFVKGLPCAACGVRGYSENAHVLGNGGIGRKADYTTIAPLCGYRGTSRTEYNLGCHAMLHAFGLSYFARQFPSFDSVEAARTTEKLWQEFQAANQPSKEK